MSELLRTPVPYRRTAYALPQAPLHYAQHVPMPDGAQIAAFVYGPREATLDELLEAHPVLALHGNGGNHATFTAVIERLVAAGKGVIALDARAQGKSTRGSLPLTYELFAKDAVAVLHALGASSVHVVGHSDGGIVGLLLARDYADDILSVVAGGANLTPEGVVDDPAWDTVGSAATNRAWASFMRDEELPESIDPALLPSWAEAQYDGELLQLMLDEPHIEAASLASITCPTCVLVGEHDCITWEETTAIAEAIPGARLVVVPGVGHSLPRQAPDSVALQVLTNVLLAD